jgi:outer membrane protein TolC
MTSQALGPRCLLFVLLCGPAAAPVVAQPAPPRTVRLGVEDAVRLALDHNPDLKVARFDPQIGDMEVAQALASFTPTFSTGLLGNREVAPPSSIFVGQQGVTSNSFRGALALSQQLSWYGGTYSVIWDGSRSTTESLFSNFNPNLAGSLRLTFSQPLLRDRAIDPAREQVTRTRTNREIADVNYREQVAQTTAQVRRAYWDFVASRVAVDVARRSLALAEDLVRTNKARVDVGEAAPLDLVSARAEVAQRAEELILAETAVRRTEDSLRTLALDAGAPDFWAVRIEPSDALPSVAPMPDVEPAVRRALEARTDLLRARAEIGNARTAVALRDNQRLPDVRVDASLLLSGVGGKRLLTDGQFPPTITGISESGFGDVLSQIVSSDFPAWTVGLTFRYPMGQSYEEADLARARLEQQRAETAIHTLEIEVARQIRSAALDMESAAKRIETTKAGRELAEERVAAEQKRYEVGMSTSFLVVQAQRDLAQTRINEVLALLSYERARIDFEALQEAGPAAGSATAIRAGVTAGRAVNFSAPAASTTTQTSGTLPGR